jgi:Flp pilus assembly pilin Flp
MVETDTTRDPSNRAASDGERGQTLVEYSLLLAFVSITAIGLTPLGQWIATRIGDVAAAL